MKSINPCQISERRFSFLVVHLCFMFSLTTRVDHYSLKMLLGTPNNHDQRKHGGGVANGVVGNQRKYSDQSSLHSRQSSLKHQHQHRPRELKVEYSAVTQKATMKEGGGSSGDDSQVIYVYCSPRLKHTLVFIFKFFLVVYCVTIPVFVYILHQKSSDNVTKLNQIQEDFQKHLQLQTSSSKTTGGEAASEKEEQQRMKRDLSLLDTKEKANRKFQEEYKRKNMSHLNTANTVEDLTRTFLQYKERLLQLEDASNWIEKFYKTYTLTNSSRDDCKCSRKNLLIQQSCTKECDCSVIKKGPIGPRGERGTKGDPGNVVKMPGVRGPQGETGLTGLKGNVGKQGPKGATGSNATCTTSVGAAKRYSTTYTRWGSNECRQQSDVKLLYSGYVAGADGTDRSGGANYLCLPEQPQYLNTSTKEGRTAAWIDGVKYGSSYSQARIQEVSKPVHCSLCQVFGKTTNIMIPGLVECPDAWLLEYAGNLVAQKRGRTSYICLANNNSRSTASRGRIKTSHSLEKVQTECIKTSVLPCDKQKYKKYMDLSCVVCSR